LEIIQDVFAFVSQKNNNFFLYKLSLRCDIKFRFVGYCNNSRNKIIESGKNVLKYRVGSLCTEDIEIVTLFDSPGHKIT
jgi:hypothetical protein